MGTSLGSIFQVYKAHQYIQSKKEEL